MQKTCKKEVGALGFFLTVCAKDDKEKSDPRKCMVVIFNSEQSAVQCTVSVRKMCLADT
jgi:hypothetical protein